MSACRKRKPTAEARARGRRARAATASRRSIPARAPKPASATTTKKSAARATPQEKEKRRDRTERAAAEISERQTNERRRRHACARARSPGRKGEGLRPTADRLRESLFNILAHGYGNPVIDARVLDLFAGTGALGIEALSRGAAYVLFVDDGVEARSLLRNNTEALGLGGTSRIFRRDATKLGPVHPLEPFTLAFLDPPYGKGLAEKALVAARDGGWLVKDALVVVEEADRREVRRAGRLRGTGTARHTTTASWCFCASADCRCLQATAVTSARTTARYPPASARHKSAGRDCTGRNSARLPSRAAARSFPRA